MMKQVEHDISLIKSKSPDGQLEIDLPGLRPKVTDLPSLTRKVGDRAVELQAMANMLRRSQGFTLAFAQCNQPSERRKLVSELRQLLGDYPRKPSGVGVLHKPASGVGELIAEIELTEPVEHLLDELLPCLPKHNNAHALFIYGLERSIHSEREFSPLVANLNTSRNSFPRYISYPLVLWLPAFAITAVMRGAPDFFSWRSALYQFPSSPEMLGQISQYALAGDAKAVLNLRKPASGVGELTLEEKKERITVIENLLADYESLPPSRRDLPGQRRKVGDRRVEVELPYRLAQLYHSLSDYVKAEDFYRRILEIGEELYDKDGIAASLHQLGMIVQERGNYEGAEHYYRQSLKIREELGDKSGIADSLHQLGIIAQFRGNYEEAEHYYQQSLEIEGKLGDRIGIADSLHQLGMIVQERGNYQGAEHYYRQSLKIREELGDKSGIANSLHQLGIIAQFRGNYEESERYYRQSLKIKEELGDKNGIANSLNQLGVIVEEREKHEQAVRLIAAVLAIFEQIGSSNQEVARESLERLRGQVEETRFETLFKEAYTDPEKVVREILSMK